MKVLLIEDNPTDALVVSILLKNQNFLVHRSSTLEEARRQLEIHSPQTILCDLSLPDAKGPELLFTLRQLAPSTALIGYSGQTPDYSPSAADYYLSKDNLTSEVLAWVLQRAFSHRLCLCLISETAAGCSPPHANLDPEGQFLHRNQAHQTLLGKVAQTTLAWAPSFSRVRAELQNFHRVGRHAPTRGRVPIPGSVATPFRWLFSMDTPLTQAASSFIRIVSRRRT